MGGYHLDKDGKILEADAIHLVRSAIDAGITFMDNCWDYNDGISEVRMGQALRMGIVRRFPDDEAGCAHGEGL